MYSLSLADNQHWRFQAVEPLHGWLRKFAAVLGLQEDSPSSAMTVNFRIRNRVDETLPDPLYDFGILALRTGGIGTEWSCDIDTAYDGVFAVDRMIYALYAVYAETVRHAGFPFHAGLVEKDGTGILLAGSSGTGKSTACRRLADHLNILCDEETLIVRDAQGHYWAHPFPTWSRLASLEGDVPCWPVQKALPISRILFLEPSGKDTVSPLGQAQATMLITRTAQEKCRWALLNPENERETRLRVFENACLMARSVKALACRATLSGPLYDMISATG